MEGFNTVINFDPKLLELVVGIRRKGKYPNISCKLAVGSLRQQFVFESVLNSALQKWIKLLKDGARMEIQRVKTSHCRQQNDYFLAFKNVESHLLFKKVLVPLDHRNKVWPKFACQIKYVYRRYVVNLALSKFLQVYFSKDSKLFFQNRARLFTLAWRVAANVKVFH